MEDWDNERYAKIQSLLPSHINSSTFIILIQAGNYENACDRKGWNEAIQACGIFWSSLPRDANMNSYLHSMESYLAEQDSNRGIEALPDILSVRVKLLFQLLQLGLTHQKDCTVDIT